MGIFLVLLLGAADTLTLPAPASALVVTTRKDVGFLSLSGEDVYVQREDGWQRYPLPQRFLLVERILARGDLCYFLSKRTLSVCDLRTSRISTLSRDSDDAVINTYGELWVVSDFRLVKLSPLGRELEEVKLSRIPESMWMLEDSLYLLYEADSLPLSNDLREGIQSLGFSVAELGITPSVFTFDENTAWILSGSRQVVRVSTDTP